MSQLNWQDIAAETGYQLVYKLVKKAEKIPVPGPEKKRLVLAELEKCKATGNAFAQAIKSFEEKNLLDNIIEGMAIANQGMRKMDKCMEMSKRLLPTQEQEQ